DEEIKNLRPGLGALVGLETFEGAIDGELRNHLAVDGRGGRLPLVALGQRRRGDDRGREEGENGEARQGEPPCSDEIEDPKGGAIVLPPFGGKPKAPAGSVRQRAVDFGLPLNERAELLPPSSKAGQGGLRAGSFRSVEKLPGRSSGSRA